MLQSVGIRPENLSRIDFAAELKSRVSGNVNDVAGSGREGKEVGNDRSMLGSGEDKGRSRKDGEPIKAADGRKVLGYVKDGENLHESMLDVDTREQELSYQARSLHKVGQATKYSTRGNAISAS